MARSLSSRSFLAASAVRRASESWLSFMGTTRRRASSSRTSTSARVSSRSIVRDMLSSHTQVSNYRIWAPVMPKTSIQADRVPQFLEETLADLLRLARQAANLAQEGLLLRGQVLRDHDLDEHVLVAPPAAPH